MRPCDRSHGLYYRASMPCVRRPSDAMHHGSFFARSPRVLLRSAHPSLHLGRLTARRLRSLRSLRSDEHDALVPRFHAMFIRLARPIASSALPCHRRVSGADPPWIGVFPLSKMRGRCARLLDESYKFRQGVENRFLRLGHTRPSVYRQRAEDVSRAATRGLMVAEITRVSGLPKPPIIPPNHGWHHPSLGSSRIRKLVSSETAIPTESLVPIWPDHSRHRISMQEKRETW